MHRRPRSTEARRCTAPRQLLRVTLASALAAAALLPLLSTEASASSHMVAFRASDGTQLAADLYEAPVQPAAAVVLVHMLTRSRLDWVATAERLQEAGILALTVDLRGHGQSGGSLDPAGDLAPMQRDVQA